MITAYDTEDGVINISKCYLWKDPNCEGENENYLLFCGWLWCLTPFSIRPQLATENVLIFLNENHNTKIKLIELLPIIIR